MASTAPPAEPQLTAEQMQQTILRLQQELQELRTTQVAPAADRRSKINLRLKEPDTFHGKLKENVDRWLFQVEQYLRAAGETVDAYKVAFAAALLRDSAAAWWETVVEGNAKAGLDESECTWDLFQEGLKKSFRAVNRSDRARDQLATLQQRTSVSDYLHRFLDIAFDIKDFGDSERYDKFYRGLKAEVKRELKILGKPEEFATLVQEAERIDSALYEDKGHKRNEFRGQKYGSGGPEPMQLGAVTPAKTAVPDDGNSSKNHTKLTDDEKAQLRREGKCFRCRQKGHLAVNCPKARRQ